MNSIPLSPISMRQYIHYIYALITVCVMTFGSAVLPGCSSSRTTTVAKSDLSAMNVGKRFDAMMASYSSWDNLEIPLKVELKSPAKFSLSGRMYMENGQSILVSMRLLGFEVATMYADSDSLYCVDKVHKIVVAENMKNLTQLTGIDITQLQSLMLGRAFLPGEPGRLSRKTKGLSFEESTDDGVEWHNWSFSLSVEAVSVTMNVGLMSTRRSISSVGFQ